MESIILFVVGIFVGMMGTIIGVGGGFIVVPLLTIGFSLSPQMAVGISMCIVALNALSGTVAYAQQKRIDYKTGILFGAATLPGSFFGAYFLQRISKPVFEVGFGFFLICLASYMFISPPVKSDGNGIDMQTFQRPDYNKPLGFFISFLVGFVASMAGIGGGVVHVPAMIYLFGFPPYIAIPTSHFILAISATFAAGSHAFVGQINWSFVPFLGAGAVIGAQAGGKLSHKVKSTWVIKGLLIAIILVAIRLIVKHI